MAVVFVPAGVGPSPSEQLVVPYPTKSMILPPVGQLPEREIELFTNATLPLFAAMFILPVASTAGRGDPIAPSLASLTRKYWPGCKIKVGKAVLAQLVPVAEAY